MTAYALIFAASLFASVHCVGMCGCFAMLCGGQKDSLAGRGLSQVIYTLGRLFTYVFLGVAAGTAGTLIWELQWGQAAIAGLSILSGIVFIVLALEILGFWRRIGGFGAMASRVLSLGLAPLIHHFAGKQTLPATFAIGVFTGLLPCGLVYAFALKAATTGGAFTGGLTMLAFGLGTAPSMVAVGLLGGSLTGAFRQRVYRFSAVILLILGVITVLRGTPVVSHVMEHNHAMAGEEARPGEDPVCADTLNADK